MSVLHARRRRGAHLIGAVLVALLVGQLPAINAAGANELDQLEQLLQMDEASQEAALDQMEVELNQTEDLDVMVEILPDELVAEMPAEVEADFTMAPSAEESGSIDGFSGENAATSAPATTSSWWDEPCAPPGQGGRQCPLPGYPVPYGLLPSNWRNNWSMPDLPIPGGNYCTSAPDRIPFLSDFRAACYQHDLAYVFTPVSRADADRKFLDNMKQACRNKHGWWNPLRYVCYGIAYIYYWAVRLFGSSHFGTTLVPGFNAVYVPPPPPPPPPDPGEEPPDPCGVAQVRSRVYVAEIQRIYCP